MATRKRLATAKEEIAEAQSRAKNARTPIAKVTTKQVLDATKRAHSGQAAHEAAAPAKRATSRKTAGSTGRRATATTRKTTRG